MKTFFKSLLNKLSCNHSYKIIESIDLAYKTKLILVCKKCGKTKIIKL